MNKFIRLGMIVDDHSGETLFIRPPRRKILKIAAVLFVVGVLLLTFTINALFAIVTLPLMFIWVYIYYFFCKIWVSYKYSKFYLITAPVVIFGLSMLIKYIFKLY